MTTKDVLREAFIAMGLDEALADVAANGRRSDMLEDEAGIKRFTAYTPFTGRPIAILEAADRIDAELWAYRNPGKVPGFAGNLVEDGDSIGLPVYQVPRQAGTQRSKPGKSRDVVIEEVTRLPVVSARKGWGR